MNLLITLGLGLAFLLFCHVSAKVVMWLLWPKDL